MGRPGPDPHQEETPAGTRIASRIYVSADALRWIEEHDAAPDSLGAYLSSREHRTRGRSVPKRAARHGG